MSDEPDQRFDLDDEPTGRPSRVYARAVVALRLLVPPAWIVAAFFAWMYGPTLGDLPSADVDALIPQRVAGEEGGGPEQRDLRQRRCCRGSSSSSATPTG